MKRFRPDADGGAYVALGDSISIDDYAGGDGRGGARLLARNRAQDFPQWQGRDLGGLPWHVLATDGATTATLDAQLHRLERLPVRASVVTVTIGGNDVLGDYGDTVAAMRVVTLVGERVGRALDRLSSLTASSARIVVGTVYDPSDGTGDTAAAGLPAWPEVVEVLAALNSTLREVAGRHGAAVADIHGHFLGHGLTVGNPAQGDPRPRNQELWYCNIIEPNAWGAGGVRAAFWEALHAGAC